MPEDMTDGETDVEISSHLSDLYVACNLVGYITPNNKKYLYYGLDKRKRKS